MPQRMYGRYSWCAIGLVTEGENTPLARLGVCYGTLAMRGAGGVVGKCYAPREV